MSASFLSTGTLPSLRAVSVDNYRDSTRLLLNPAPPPLSTVRVPFLHLSPRRCRVYSTTRGCWVAAACPRPDAFSHHSAAFALVLLHAVPYPVAGVRSRTWRRRHQSPPPYSTSRSPSWTGDDHLGDIVETHTSPRLNNSPGATGNDASAFSALLHTLLTAASLTRSIGSFPRCENTTAATFSGTSSKDMAGSERGGEGGARESLLNVVAFFSLGAVSARRAASCRALTVVVFESSER